CWHKSPNVLSQVAIGKEKPLAVNVGQMIGVDGAGFGARTTGLAVGEDELLSLGCRLSQRVEDGQVQDRLSAGAKRDGLVPFLQVHRDSLRECFSHLSKSAQERFLETGSPILLERFLGYDECKQFAFGDLESRKGLNFVGIIVTSLL